MNHWSIQCPLERLLHHLWPSRRQSCSAGDDEGVQRLLTLCSLQRSPRRQNLTGSQFVIESVEHLQNVCFPCGEHMEFNSIYSTLFTGLVLIVTPTVLRVAARLQSAQQDFPERPPWDVLKPEGATFRWPSDSLFIVCNHRGPHTCPTSDINII